MPVPGISPADYCVEAASVSFRRINRHWLRSGLPVAGKPEYRLRQEQWCVRTLASVPVHPRPILHRRAALVRASVDHARIEDRFVSSINNLDVVAPEFEIFNYFRAPHELCNYLSRLRLRLAICRVASQALLSSRRPKGEIKRHNHCPDGADRGKHCPYVGINDNVIRHAGTVDRTDDKIVERCVAA